MVRLAFTLIELIFAIVIIAISVLSLPMMTQVTSKGVEENIVQEAIFASEAILADSSSYFWDKSSIEDYATANKARVVNTGDCIAGSPNKRIGHISRDCLDNNMTVPFNGVDASSLEWASNVYNNSPILTGTASSGSYKNSYNMTVTVNNCKTGPCLQFGKEANNEDLKEIKVTLTNGGSADPRVVLRMYAANIGEPTIASRGF